MEIPRLRTLSECSDHLAVLSGVADHSMSQLRAPHFRKAERCLTHLNHEFTEELAHAAKEWIQTKNSVRALHETLSRAQRTESQIEELNDDLTELDTALSDWRPLTSTQKEDLFQLSERAKTYLDRSDANYEEKTLGRFELYNELKPLVPYAEEVDHLCSAVKHYAKRDAYEQEKAELETKIMSAEIRCKSVRRGFFLSLVLCVLVVTIPLCVPFAFSLWNRIREIEKQLSEHTESRRRVLRRLELADEGVVAAEDITAVLGERSLSDIRSILEDVRLLHREFGASGSNQSPLSQLIVLEANLAPVLQSLFPNRPEAFRERLQWLVRHVEQKRRQSQQIAATAEEILRLQKQRQETMRGYNSEILNETVNRLELRMLECFPLQELDLEPDARLQFARLCQQLPQILNSVQGALSRISYSKEVRKAEWEHLGVEVKSASSTLKAIVLEAQWGTAASEEDEEERVGTR